MLWRDASSDHEGNTDEKQLTESRSGKRRGASRDRTHGRKEPRIRLMNGALPVRQPRREEWQMGSAQRKKGAGDSRSLSLSFPDRVQDLSVYFFSA